MTTSHTNELVAAYLQRLERAADSLPRARRAELVAEIREHIDDALLEAGAADEVAVRNVLERLGPPEDIAAAAVPQSVPVRAGKLEVAALIALAVPFAGWLVGIPLMLLSRAWIGRDKAIAAFLVFVPLLLGLVLAISGSESGANVPVGTPDEPAAGGLGPLELGILVGGFLGGLAGAVYLALRLRRDGEPRVLEA
jgi:hypothetical protein